MADGHDEASGRDSEAQRGAQGEVTDADRGKARAMYDSWFGGSDMDDEITSDIATALAKAREPFLRVADEIEGLGVVMGSEVAKDIRRVAEDQQ